MVSLSSKCIFEKNLLEEYIKEHGKDPVTNEELSVDQVIEINVRQLTVLIFFKRLVIILISYIVILCES